MKGLHDQLKKKPKLFCDCVPEETERGAIQRVTMSVTAKLNQESSDCPV